MKEINPTSNKYRKWFYHSAPVMKEELANLLVFFNESKDSFFVIRCYFTPAFQVTRIFNNLEHNIGKVWFVDNTFVVAFTLLKVSKMQTGWW